MFAGTVFLEKREQTRTKCECLFANLRRQVQHQHCTRTGRVQKNKKKFGKNTKFNEHPVKHSENFLDLLIRQYF